MFHVPHGLTYNDMLTEFTDTKYHWASRVAVIKTIKATFKKLTGVSINELVSGYNYQQVIDALSNAKIPHCTFADWLRCYEWETPQQSEVGEAGNTFAAHIAKSEIWVEGVLANEPVESYEASENLADLEDEVIRITKRLDDGCEVTLMNLDPSCAESTVMFNCLHGWEMTTGDTSKFFESQKYYLTKERQMDYINYYVNNGWVQVYNITPEPQPQPDLYAPDYNDSGVYITYQAADGHLVVKMMQGTECIDLIRKSLPSAGEHYKDAIAAGYTLDKPEVKQPATQSEPLKVIDVFVAVYGESDYCFDRLTNFLTKRDQYDCDHGIDSPWEVVDDIVENHLRGWFRNLYPTTAQLAKLR